jgi:hypothetical protein
MLDELRQSPSSYKKFLNSPAAEGISAGFEAEMIFPNLSDPDAFEYDYDENRSADDIDDVIDFFSPNYTESFLQRFRKKLLQDYTAWCRTKFEQDYPMHYVKEYIKEQNDWDEEEAVERYLVRERYTNGEINDAIDAHRKLISLDKPARGLINQNDLSLFKKASEAAFEHDFEDELLSAEEDTYDDDNYLKAFEQWVQNDYDNNCSESDFFDDEGIPYMLDIGEHYEVDWPYTTESGGGYNYSSASELAQSLHDELNVKTTASESYHGARRDDKTWIFEPDSSLEAANYEDMPVEIVSPPMPLPECLTKLQEFFAWAEEHYAYTNESTGFHMSVSLPKHDRDNIDFVKLALFLGEKKVLEEFGRLGNKYCKQVLPKLKAHIADNPKIAEQALDSLKSGLSKIASTLISPDQRFDKFFTINPTGNYVEFRSAGGYNYHEDVDKLQNTLSRYAQALYVAGNRDEEKNKYAKKLYKLLEPSSDGTDTLAIFSKYAAGEINRNELKRLVSTAQLTRFDKRNNLYPKAPTQDDKTTSPSGSWDHYDPQTMRLFGRYEAPNLGALKAYLGDLLKPEHRVQPSVGDLKTWPRPYDPNLPLAQRPTARPSSRNAANTANAANAALWPFPGTPRS